MKKLLSVSLLLMSAVAFADRNTDTTEGNMSTRLESFTNETRYEVDHYGGRENNHSRTAAKVEWTLGKGSYDLSEIVDGLKFKFDVDRDINLDADDNKTYNGWDTAFALETKYDWGTMTWAGLEYDQDDYGSSHGEEYDYKMGPTWNVFGGNLKTHLAYSKETGDWADMDPAEEYGLDIDYYKEYLNKDTSFGNFTYWNSSEIDLRKVNGAVDSRTGYNIDGSDYRILLDEDYVNLYNEMELKYTTPSFGPFYGALALYSEAEWNSHYDGYYVTGEITPSFGAKFNAGNWNINPYVSYDVFDQAIFSGDASLAAGFVDDEGNHDDGANVNHGDREFAAGLKLSWKRN